MTTTATLAAENMGLSRATYYRVRDELLRKKCLMVRQQMDAPSVYVVNEVSHWETHQEVSETEEVSHGDTHVSHGETPLSHGETKVSHGDNTKKKEEEIEEEVKEEKQSPVPSGPVDLEVKEQAKGRHFLSPLEKREVQRACFIRPNLNEEDALEMMDWIGNRLVEGKTFNERLNTALRKKGVNTDEW